MGTNPSFWRSLAQSEGEVLLQRNTCRRLRSAQKTCKKENEDETQAVTRNPKLETSLFPSSEGWSSLLDGGGLHDPTGLPSHLRIPSPNRQSPALSTSLRARAKEYESIRLPSEHLIRIDSDHPSSDMAHQTAPHRLRPTERCIDRQQNRRLFSRDSTKQSVQTHLREPDQYFLYYQTRPFNRPDSDSIPSPARRSQRAETA